MKVKCFMGEEILGDGYSEGLFTVLRDRQDCPEGHAVNGLLTYTMGES